MELGMVITGDLRVGIRFEEFPQEMYHALFDTIEELTGMLEDLVRGSVPVKTGNLEGHVQSKVNAYPDRIAGVVGFGRGEESQIYAQAAALEYGAHKLGEVKAHAFKLDHLFSEAWGPALVMIKEAYERTPNIEEHNFLRGSLEEMSGEIISALQATMDQKAEQFKEAA